MQAPTPQLSLDSLTTRLREVFAEVTRYPLEILDAEADLEEDLGIDSVKLGEALAVVRERFELPEDADLPPDQLKTIGRISQALHGYLGSGDVPVIEPAEPAERPAESATPTPVPSTNGREAAAGISRPARVPAPSTADDKPFAGKVALVSGSGRGLGKAIADHLADRGATVVVNSFHSRARGAETAEAITARGGEASHIWGSMANEEHVGALFDEIESSHGGLDFFVSNASNGMLARLEDLTSEHWEKAFRTNVIGLHQAALRALPLMRRRGGGKIVTLSSPASHGYVDYFGCMGAIKAAVESLTRSMAVEFAPDNIQVNCVSPGPVYGELLNKWPESDRLVTQWEDNTPYGRLCEGEDVAQFVAYLLQEDVRLFTGSVLVMDGGISAQGW